MPKAAPEGGSRLLLVYHEREPYLAGERVEAFRRLGEAFVELGHLSVSL
jgi:hypothetical protein